MARIGRPKGARNKKTLAREKAMAEYQGCDPREYLASILADPEQYDDKRFMAANALMPYTYARLSSSKIDADVTNHPTKEQASEAAELVKEQIKANGHTNGTNGAAVVVNGASTSEG